MADLLPDVPAAMRHGCVSLGNFDGVHPGHQRMLGVLRELAQRLGCPAVAITFDPHPLQVLRPEVAPPLLTTIAERRTLLQKAGVDHVYCLRVTRDLLAMSAGDFFDRILIGRFDMRGIVEGPNFMFGRDRGGTVHTLQSMCRSADRACEIVSLIRPHGQELSSSAIRRRIAEGQVSDAARLLGRPYALSGTVEAGERRGTGLGYPTANLTGIATILPQDGVYAAEAEHDGQTTPAAVSIGPNPTFGSTERKVECHLLDFSDDLYGQTIRLRFLERVRGQQRFRNVEDLKAQIGRDVRHVREIVQQFASTVPRN